ncbi:WD repeat-containing protein WRAP73 [Cephus cinctus]|uniref:WD repeat-containing protein WRAP73 n=1 Tax=Cephus cinctus TaxID=211228 RepID=A0AAJ7VXW7_CEPCN|nr:WD repeat-containing protein WRAP73 [Cephus cinctus]
MTTEVENEIFRMNSNLCSFSNDERFLAVAFQGNLIIKNTGTFDTFQSYVFGDIIEYIEWSLDSEYILCSNFKKAVVRVFSICFPEWRCKLIEGSAGLERVIWSPDNRHIITVADFNIQISIWSLENRNVTYIQNSKSSTNKKLEFSPNGKKLALIVAENDEDNVAIYKTKNWKISRKLICERLKTINGICWSPDSELLCIWCSNIGESKLLVFSAILDSHVGVYSPEDDTDKGDIENEFKRGIKGINKVKWIPSGQLIAITGYNEMVVLINYVTWKPLLELYLNSIINESDYMNKVYKECIIQIRDSNKYSSVNGKHLLEEINDRPINIPIVKRENNTDPIITDVDILEFSSCGRYLAVRYQAYPTTLWIWDINIDSVEYLILRNPITSVKWSPTCSRLIALTETPHIFEWCPEGATCIQTPKGIIVSDVQWHLGGKILALCGYNKGAIFNIFD